MSSFELFLGGIVGILSLATSWALFLMRNYRDDMDKLRKADHEMRNHLQTAMLSMTRDLGAIEKLVAGQYVTRQEFKDGLEAQTKVLLARMDDLSKYMARTENHGR